MLLTSIYPRTYYSRIISLVPSQTELLFDLGLDEEIVGVTKFCIHPKNKTRTKAQVGGTKKVHMDRIHALKPDLIIANKEENVKEEIEALAETYDVWLTDVNTLDEGVRMIQDIAELTHTEHKAFGIQQKILQEFAALNSEPLDFPIQKAAYFIWRDPYMVAASDTFIHTMFRYCGLENAFANAVRYPETTVEDLKKRKTQVILLSSEPYPFKEKHKKEMEELLPGIPVLLVDGEMFSWYGSRLQIAPAYFRTVRQELSRLFSC